jgi:hypothetical protein
MEYAANPRTLPTRRTLVAPFVALLIGAAAAVGGYALIDNQDTVQAPDKVVFVDTPGPGEGVRGIDDTATAAAIDSTPPKVVVPYLSHGYGVQTSDGGGSIKDEAATAAAISSGSAQDADSANRTAPHGPAGFQRH